MVRHDMVASGYSYIITYKARVYTSIELNISIYKHQSTQEAGHARLRASHSALHMVEHTEGHSHSLTGETVTGWVGGGCCITNT